MYCTNSISLRDSIKKFAVENHLTSAQIAKRAAIHPVSLSRIMSGKTKAIQLETLQKLENAGVKLDLTSDEDYAQDKKDLYLTSQASIIGELFPALIRLCPQTAEMNEIYEWTKTPAGQRLFWNGMYNAKNIIAQLLVFLKRKGLLQDSMPELPDIRPGSPGLVTEKEIKLGLEMSGIIKKQSPD
jgi:transcriptional regulator with XRE-family HTH domain